MTNEELARHLEFVVFQLSIIAPNAAALAADQTITGTGDTVQTRFNNALTSFNTLAATIQAA